MLRKRQMKKGYKIALITLVVVALAALAARLLLVSPLAKRAVRTTFSGVVLVNDLDVGKQVPLHDAVVSVTIGQSVAQARSDESGYFHLILPRQLANQTRRLTVEHADYAPFEDLNLSTRQLYIARLTPLTRMQKPALDGPKLGIRNVRIRYTVKAENTINIGSIVRSFSVPNQANQPCGKTSPCSPDKKWKAQVTEASYDAGDSNQFVNIRVSCIAGPCPFTRIQSGNIDAPVRVIKLSVLNWSDPATYLLEAEVRRTQVSDMVRQAFPAILGASMDFTLPASAEGPSIDAELNGTDVVFPLGPNLLLSWATCTAETGRDHTHLYRCDLKPTFEFR